MGIFTRTFTPAILLTATIGITTIGLGACDNNTDVANRSATAADVITISRPRIRATAPGQKVSGAFLTLTNASSTPYALTSASFGAAGMVEIHETSMNGKMMRMMQVEQVDIPANSSVELKPGSYHIMLMGLEKELVAGTTEPLTLTFSDSSRINVEASVGDLND